jgi:hypothetical protein
MASQVDPTFMVASASPERKRWCGEQSQHTGAGSSS